MFVWQMKTIVMWSLIWVCQWHCSIKMLILNGMFQHWLITAMCQENQSTSPSATNKPNVVVQSHWPIPSWRMTLAQCCILAILFFDHVAFLQSAYQWSNTLTLMKLNLLQGDLAERFVVSQGVVLHSLSSPTPLASLTALKPLFRKHATLIPEGSHTATISPAILSSI